MKLFFYKSILIFFLFLIGFHFSFSHVVKKLKSEIKSVVSKEKAEEFKIQIKKEMQKATEKENYIKPKDAIIINKFLEKIRIDLEKNK
tara:strand:+ start:400 stop:663 length:264 start_codon:yes stop_codon:yes gene_type:complete